MKSLIRAMYLSAGSAGVILSFLFLRTAVITANATMNYGYGLLGIGVFILLMYSSVRCFQIGFQR